jgi:competence protein ComEC
LVGLVGFVSGIGLGIGAPPVPAWVLGTAGAAVAVALGRPGWRLLALTVLLGYGHGRTARALDGDRCAGRLPEGVIALELRLLEPAISGRPARAEPLASCRGSIGLRQTTGDTLWAGATVRVEGRWIPRPSRWRPADGILVTREVRALMGPANPTPSERLRNWIIRQIGGLYGSRAGMIEALVLGSRGTIDPGLAQSFARTGLVHLLSISGFHVGLVWAWVILVLGALGRRRAAPVVASILVVGYVTFIGAPAPALRATLLGIGAAIEAHRQRHVAAGGLAAVVALVVLLVDPWAATDLGAWLSVTALWGATAAGRWSERVVGRSAVGSVLASSTGATLATSPLTALVFGSVSVVGVALNLIAIPLASFALPAVLMSLLIAPLWTAGSQALAAGGGLLLHLLEVTAVRGAAAPAAAVTFEPGLEPALLALVAMIGAVWIFGRQNRPGEIARRGASLAGVVLVLGLAMAVLRRPHLPSGLTLHFLDVGQGDAALVKTAAGSWILIDAGPRDERADAGRRVIVPFLIRHGVRRLAAVIVSHGHRDHFGGLPAVLDAVAVEQVFEPGLPVPDRDYLDLLDRLSDHGVGWRPLRAGDRVRVDEATLEVLHPDTSWSGWGDDLNENSLVVRLDASGFAAMLVGDAGFPVEQRLAADSLRPIDLLKVGHHGSRSATGSGWLARLRPRAAVVSVGANRYGHPSPEAIDRLDAAGVPLWRTDRDGTVTVRVRGGTMRIAGRQGTTDLLIHE